MAALVVGVDVGGTTTRVGLAGVDGHVRLVVEGPGANPNSVGLAQTGDRIRRLVTQVLTEADVRPADVGALTVALAGATRVLASTEHLEVLQRAMSPPGLVVTPRLVQDVAAAFGAGSPADSGVVLVAGTGSIAARVDRGAVQQRVGGWGWLLGDEGSGFWLGREAVRHTLAAAESGRPPGRLAEAVLEAYGVLTADQLLAATYAASSTGTPYEPGSVTRTLAALSPEVARLADHDPAADALVDHAVDHLVDLVDRLTAGAGTGPLVLAGSLLTSVGPVGARAEARLAAAGHRVVPAGPAVVGPLWLAIRSLRVDGAEVHHRLRTAIEP